MYLSYLPGTAALGWSGRWDDLPAAHFTSGLFDLLTMGKIALSDPPWQAFPTEVYVVLALIYIMFCFAMSKYSRGLERELGRAQRR